MTDQNLIAINMIKKNYIMYIVTGICAFTYVLCTRYSGNELHEVTTVTFMADTSAQNHPCKLGSKHTLTRNIVALILLQNIYFG